MGINSKDLQLVVRLAEEGLIRRGGKVIEIGTQQLSNSFLKNASLVRKAEALFGAEHPFKLPDPLPATLGQGGIELLDSKAPFARDFWTSLGFDYVAIDVDGSPGSIPLDLNFDSVPAELQGKYDLVTNLGTTEHICNQLNAFRAIHDLAAPGAIMIHHLPAGGALNHGLVNYNPKFFWYLARSNDYKWCYLDYYGGDNYYTLPDNIVTNAALYEPQALAAMRERTTADYAIQVALQKTLDIPFVPPLDVETDTPTNDSAMKRRYWTIFQPSALYAARKTDGAKASFAHFADGRQADTGSQCHAEVFGEIGTALNNKIRSVSDRIPAAIARSIIRIPGRKFIALIATLSALAGGLFIAIILAIAGLLHF
jgi:hypothetical protein